MNKLLQMTLLAAVLSTLVNFAIRVIFVAGLDVSTEFPPFAFPQIAIFTILGVVGGAGVFAYLLRRSPTPVATFNRIALVVLLLSFIPDLGILVGDPDPEQFPGISTAGVVALILMHIVTAGFVVWLFPRAVEANP